MGFPIGSVANLSLYGRSVNCQSQFQRDCWEDITQGEPIGASMRTIAHHPSIFTPRCGALQEKDWNPNSAGDPRRAANGNKELLLLLELLRHFKWPIAELLWKENLVKIPGMLPPLLCSSTTFFQLSVFQSFILCTIHNMYTRTASCFFHAHWRSYLATKCRWYFWI